MRRPSPRRVVPLGVRAQDSPSLPSRPVTGFAALPANLPQRSRPLLRPGLGTEEFSPPEASGGARGHRTGATKRGPRPRGDRAHSHSHASGKRPLA